MNTSVYDYQVGGQALADDAALLCATCRRRATVRLTINRIERHGQLVPESRTDYCDDHISEATTAARTLCQARLYGHKGAA